MSFHMEFGYPKEAEIDDWFAQGAAQMSACL